MVLLDYGFVVVVFARHWFLRCVFGAWFWWVSLIRGDYFSGFDSGFMLRCGGCGWCDCGWFPMIMVDLVFVVFLVWCLGCGWLRLLV